VDFRHQILPNVLTLPGVLLGILLSPFQDQSLFRDTLSFNFASLLSMDNPDRWLPWVGSILGAFISAGLLFLVDFAYRMVRKRQGLGMGDVKMMGMVGAVLGWRLALLTIFAGSLLGSIAGVFLIAFRGKNLSTKLPFGSFLGFGAILALFFGLTFITWYTTAR
jgi:leader peptidase (prepilin peptidase)/N-methyltransferase